MVKIEHKISIMNINILKNKKSSLFFILLNKSKRLMLNKKALKNRRKIDI